MKKIRISLSDQSIKSAIDELKQYKSYVAEKTKLLCEKLAMIGAQEASIRFSSAMYDGKNDVSVTVSQTANGFSIVASGEAVAFIEFGSGVYYNGSEPYPEARPTGIVGIGEYGKGYGKRKAWGYRENEKVVITHGNPAAMPMWYATKEMEQNVLRIAKEVFE
ncbi:MAG: hypothetical protein WCS30_14235 [Selenomonadaceae bacterium]